MPGPDEDIGSIGDKASKVNDLLTTMVQNFKSLYDQATNLWGPTSKRNVDDYTTSVDNLGGNFQSLMKDIDNVSGSLEVLGANGITNLNSLSNPLDKLTGAFLNLQTVVDQSKVFQQFSTESSSAIDLVSSNLDNLRKIMGDLKIPGLNTVVGLATGFVSNAEEAEKLENSFVALSAVGGELNKVFDSETGQLRDLSALTAAYSNLVSSAADATGLSVHQTMEFANALKQIPGSLDESIRTTGKSSTETNSLVSVMRLATGTARSEKEVIDALNFAYDTLSTSQGKVSNSTQKGEEFFAVISETANTLHLRFNDVRSVMEEIAKSFQFVGNETDGAARTLARYSDALRETGLTGKASLDIIKTMTDNIANLNIGTKAFLSLRSGGPGGLQGAFQIEQLLRQGKIDQVIQMAERNLRQQFGGRIFTQAEAAGSPEAASQFMRQRMLLQSGAFGIGRGLSDAQATRLLEALGKQDIGAVTKELRGGQEALTSATDQGVLIQQRNNNELKNINRAVERNAIAAEITAGVQLRQLIGTTGGRAAGINQGMGRAVDIGRIQTGQRLSIEQGGIGAAGAQALAEQLITMERGAVSGIKGSVSGLAEGLANGVRGAFETVSEAGAAIEQKNREIERQIGGPRGPVLTRPHIDAPMEARRIVERVTREKEAGGGAAAAMANVPQKVILEILAPPGFDLKTRSSSESISINVINKQSAVPDVGGGNSR